MIQELEEKGLAWLQGAVEEVDPEFYAQVDRSNPQRLMRALEIWRGTGLKFSSFRIKNKVQRPFEIVKIGLDLEVDYSKTWTCYEGQELACGKCGSCNERLEAFALNNSIDPLLYKN